MIQYKVATPETHTNSQNGLSGLYMYIQVYTYMYVTLIIKEKEAIKLRERSWETLDRGHLEWAQERKEKGISE